MIYGVIAGFALFAALDARRLLRAGRRRDAIRFGICAGVVAGYMALHALDVRLPSSVEALHDFVGNRLGLRYGVP